ncbi:MAG: PL29 family lyase N-terminal domain-containing protein [Mangrovibacterium sp.]
MRKKRRITKTAMVKTWFLLLAITAVLVTSCKDYDDDIDRLEEQIAALKTTVDAVNTAVQGGSVITSVTSITNGIKITLSNNQSYDITNGAAGPAGADGADGSVVSIGANGNWFIDGTDTGKPSKGADGADGADGAYYVPNADGFWHKVDASGDVATTQTWLPEGTITATLVNGVVTLYNVEGADGPVVLGKGELAGLLFAPNTMEDGVGVIDLGYIDGTLGTSTVKSTFQTNQKLNFRFNPSSADLSETTWSYVANSVKFRSAPNADNASIFTVSSFTDKTGWGEFGLQVTGWAEPASGESRVLALKGTSPEGEGTKVVTSDYVKVVPVLYTAAISDSKKTEFTHYVTTAPIITATSDHELIYTATNLELLDYVWATASLGTVEKKFADYGFTDYKFEFSTATNYAGLDGVTNQNAFVQLNGSKLTVLQGTASIDRTPLIKVTLKSSLNEAVLATGYIKFTIVRQPTVPPTAKTYTFDGGTINYASLFNGEAVIADNKTDIVVDWTRMNQIYSELGMSHNQFRITYNVIPTAVPASEIGNIVTSTEAPNVDSYAMKYQITPLAKFGVTTVTYTFTPTSTAYPVLNFVFTYNIVKPTLDKTILDGYRYNGSATDIMTQGMNAGSNYLMQLYLGEAFAFGTSAYRNVFAVATNDKIDGATHTFQFRPTPVQTGAQLTPATGGTIDEALGTSTAPTSGQLMDLTTKLITAERVYDMQFVTTYPNAETDVFDFKVHFVNPFEIKLASPVDFQLIDKVNGTADTEDVMDNYIVTFKGKNIITKGVAETSNTATTVKASDFVDLTNASYGLFYKLTPGTQYFTISKAPSNDWTHESVLTWDNSGTQLITEQNVATTQVTFKSSFAEITKTADNVTVKPE